MFRVAEDVWGPTCPAGSQEHMKVGCKRSLTTSKARASYLLEEHLAKIFHRIDGNPKALDAEGEKPQSDSIKAPMPADQKMPSRIVHVNLGVGRIPVGEQFP